MFSFTEALNKSEVKQGYELPDDVSPQRHSNYLPEKHDDPASPDSTITANTRVPSPGLEPMRSDDETLKEAAAIPYFDPPGQHGFDQEEKELSPEGDHTAKKDEGGSKRLRFPWIIAAGILLVILAIALGVGLGVGLKNKA